MIVERLELVDFRNYADERFDLTEGTTVVVGDNGHGKTNFAEALSYLATLSSFRGVANEAMIRDGAERAVVRAVVAERDGRRSSVDAELTRVGPGRVFVNRQRLRKSRDLLGTVRVTVFSPDDLALVKGSPSFRRRFLDEVLVALARKHDALRLEVDRALRQRNVLLKQAGGALDGDAKATLDVWDQRLAGCGGRFGEARAALVAALAPLVQGAYAELAGECPVRIDYDPPWRRSGLAAALAAARAADVRLRVSTVGPHRDDLDMSINSLPARTHGSQGEQRTLALALRLAAHRHVDDETGSTPVLVLDDVLSELDASRADALLRHLPSGQVVITTAGVVPDGATPDQVIRIERGSPHGGT